MQYSMLGPVGSVSRMSLGGGGIGQVWGETSPEEAVATLKLAIDRGINLIDTAPLYRNCEAIVARTFQGKPPGEVLITSKCRLGSPPPSEVEERLKLSIDNSLSAMHLDRLAVFFLHTNICADDYSYSSRADRQNEFATRWSLYANEVVPAMERLEQVGKIAHWGITGAGVPQSIVAALGNVPRPAVVQAITNLLDSAGSMKNFAEREEPRTIIATAVENGIGVMGIRAVQAGALTQALDRPLPANHAEARDYVRAEPFRALCREIGDDPASVAHRYALSMPGVDTVVLGVKNRAELEQCLAAEARGDLEVELIERIDGLNLRNAAS